jgi:hypothetical protein
VIFGPSESHPLFKKRPRGPGRILRGVKLFWNRFWTLDFGLWTLDPWDRGTLRPDFPRKFSSSSMFSFPTGTVLFLGHIFGVYLIIRFPCNRGVLYQMLGRFEVMLIFKNLW